jgi:hypothetical protein
VHVFGTHSPPFDELAGQEVELLAHFLSDAPPGIRVSLDLRRFDDLLFDRQVLRHPGAAGLSG